MTGAYTHNRRDTAGPAPHSRAGKAGDDGTAISGVTPRLYQRAYEILAHRIADGAIAPGERLTETGVAARFGISRAPARQALAELAEAGLVEKPVGRRGYVVRGGDAGQAVHAAADGNREIVALTSPPSWERIYTEVEREIAARTPFARWRVNEAEMARHYGVSRTVTRDVLGRLQQRGVIQKDERSRWLVPALSPKRVTELYELRWILEPVALCKAAPNLPGGYAAAMRRELEESMTNASWLQGAVLDRLEERMHIDLLGYCGNDSLMQAIVLPQSLLIAHRFLYRWTPRLFEAEPFLPEHLEIVRQLEHGGTAEAARSLEVHLRVSRDRAIARIDAVARQFQPDDLSFMKRIA